MLELTHLEAVLRGWYPSWLAQLRAAPTETYLIWGLVLAAFLGTARTLHSAR
jgi:hypothetical protein